MVYMYVILNEDYVHCVQLCIIVVYSIVLALPLCIVLYMDLEINYQIKKQDAEKLVRNQDTKLFYTYSKSIDVGDLK